MKPKTKLGPAKAPELNNQEQSTETKEVSQYNRNNEIVTLDGLLESVRDIETEETAIPLEIGGPRTKQALKNKSTLQYSKYLKTAKVPETLKDIYEEIGITDYEAFIHSFSSHKCEDCGKTFYVNMRGSGNNPYMSFKSTLSSASKQTKKLRNLLMDYTMLKVVPTFPKEISEKLRDENKDMDEVQEKMWDCLKLFLSKFREQKTTHDRQIMASASPHIWKSENPGKGPHAHFHLDIPMLQMDFPSTTVIKEFEIKNMRKLRQYYRTHEDRKEEIAEYLNRRLVKHLNMDGIPWIERESGKVPVEHGNIKDLWTESVNEVFETDFERLNLNLEHYFSRNKPKMLHDLTYRSRKPVLDIAMSVIKGTESCKSEYDKIDSMQQIKQNKSWIKTLIEYDNRTRIFGAWNSIKQLLKYGPRDEDPECRLCGGELMSNGCTHETLEMSEIDQFVCKSGKKIQIFRLKDPPPISKDQET